MKRYEIHSNPREIKVRVIDCDLEQDFCSVVYSREFGWTSFYLFDESNDGEIHIDTMIDVLQICKMLIESEKR